jgi:hypothetical protein
MDLSGQAGVFIIRTGFRLNEEAPTVIAGCQARTPGPVLLQSG